MTSRFPVGSDHQASIASNESSVTTRIADEGPYARPVLPPHRAVDAVLIDAIRASVGPFVPAPWRTLSASTTPTATVVTGTFQVPVDEPIEEAQSVDDGEALPWIESFLDASAGEATVVDQPPASEAATSDTVAGIVSGGECTAAVESTADSSAELPIEPIGDSSASATAEEWPIEEAGDAIRAIADDLVRNTDDPNSIADSARVASDAAAPSLRMWSDDDMMDIMPVRTSTPEVTGAEQWAARARRESEEGSPEAAARALEALASRVRSGEIQLPTFSPEMGEAAALAAALAALLTLRR